MNRLLPLLLSLMLLGGCTRYTPAPSSETVTPEIPVTSAPLPVLTPAGSSVSVQEQEQQVLVHYLEEEKDYKAEGSHALLLHYRCRTPYVELPGSEKQAGLINVALASMAESFRSGSGVDGDGLESLLAAAVAAYAESAAGGQSVSFASCAYERDCSVVRGDGQVLSFLFSNLIHNGDSETAANWSSVSFDPKSGDRLSLSDLAEDEAALRSICISEILSQCEGKKNLLYEDYASRVEKLFTDGLWYLNDSGLVFISNEGSLAPSELGTMSFTVRYKALSGVLSERFSLPRRETVQGGLEVVQGHGEKLGSAQPLLTVGLTEPGELFALRAVNHVYNVRLFSVSYDEASGRFLQQQELAYLNLLRDGEYFRVQSAFPDVIPNLQLSWRLPDGSSQLYLLSQSGKDGTILLLEPNTIGRVQPGIVTDDPFRWDLDGDGRSESVSLSLADVWTLTVEDTESYTVVTRFTADRPKLYVADVDEDECCELFAEAENTLCCYRYDGMLSAVDFTVMGNPVRELNATVLDVGADGLHLSCNIPLMGSKLAAQALFRDGPNGSLALAYGSEWDFFTHGSLSLREEISCMDGTKLPVGAVITPLTMNDSTLRFSDAGGNILVCDLTFFS